MHLKLHYEIESKLRSERADRRLQSLRVMNDLQNSDTPEEQMDDKDHGYPEDREEEEEPKEAFGSNDRDIEPKEAFGSNDGHIEPKEAFGSNDRDIEPKEAFGSIDKNIEPKEAFGSNDGHIEPKEAQVNSQDSEFSYWSAGGSSSQKKILVVEDEREMAEVLIDLLEKNGYPVIAVSSLALAETVFEERMEEVGCVFVDMLLPDGSGIDLIKSIRSMNSEVPILAGSGYTLSSRDSDYLRESRIDFVKKPYNKDSLILILDTIFPPYS
ncbi:MAG: response regulator [Candidatus Aegiribacteria sp.]|nr:response regulator [Candidatus Aegiribacteria sp.]MBD3295304.1 response regulator [Candidatus Fermentibacteria bacterium]